MIPQVGQERPWLSKALSPGVQGQYSRSTLTNWPIALRSSFPSILGSCALIWKRIICCHHFLVDGIGPGSRTLSEVGQEASALRSLTLPQNCNCKELFLVPLVDFSLQEITACSAMCWKPVAVTSKFRFARVGQVKGEGVGWSGGAFKCWWERGMRAWICFCHPEFLWCCSDVMDQKSVFGFPALSLWLCKLVNIMKGRSFWFYVF